MDVLLFALQFAIMLTLGLTFMEIRRMSDALTQAVSDLSTAVADGSTKITTALQDLAASTTAATSEMSDLVTALENSSDPAAAEAAAKLEALVSQVNDGTAAAVAGIEGSAKAMSDATAAAKSAVEPPPPAPPPPGPPAPPVPAAISIDTSGAPTTATVGVSYTGSVTASGGQGDISMSVSGLPDGLTSSGTPGALSISGTPATAGTFPVVFSASDGSGDAGSTSETFTVAEAPAP